MFRPMTALAASLLTLAGAPALAQSGTGPLICVSHEAGYVARLTFEHRVSGRWQQTDRLNTTMGDRPCRRFGSGIQDTRITVEGHTGFSWRQACRHEFTGGQSVNVTVKGTSLHQSCGIY